MRRYMKRNFSGGRRSEEGYKVVKPLIFVHKLCPERERENYPIGILFPCCYSMFYA